MIWLSALKLAGSVPKWVWPMLLLAGYASCTTVQKNSAVKKYEDLDRAVAEERAANIATAKELTRVLNSSRARINDDLNKAQAEVSVAAAGADSRLRNLAASWAASAAAGGARAACGDDGAPIVSVLRDEDRRAFISLAEEANRVSARLAACQSWVGELRGTLN